MSEEFDRHKLMPTQMPVTDSDRTRGMAIAAAVMRPRLMKVAASSVIGGPTPLHIPSE